MKVILVDAVNAFIIKDEGIFRKMYEVLEQYPNKKIILTNANDQEMKKFGLNDVPYDLFTLKHEPEKTEPEYYRIMLNHFDLDVSKVIYFEHNKEAAKSASSIGINTFHYDAKEKNIQSLKKFIDDNL